MKVLYVENLIMGHHFPYLQALSSSKEYESAVIIPTKAEGLSAKQYVFSKMDYHTKKISDYLECMHFIAKVAQEEQADIVHFLDGDKIMRYFGLGMGAIARKHRVVITYHHFFPGTVRKISYQLMSRSRFPVVHTTEIQEAFHHYGLGHVTHIEYPSFLALPKAEKKNDVPVIGMFGGTRYDKGLDILLAALAKVQSPFRLVVAGRAVDFTEKLIKEMSVSFIERLTLDLRFLTEEELASYWNMTDLVVLPYRAIFDGASGQLTEGVCRELPVIGPSHGSLGSIISKNHLGYTYRTEDVDDLAEKIEKVLADGFSYDDVAQAYKRQMSPERFCDDYLRLYRSVL